MSQIQMPEMEGIDFGELNLANMYKEMAIKEWIATDSYLFMKTENHMIIEISADDIEAIEEEDFEKIVEDVTTQMIFYGYNEAVSIELPTEAFQSP